MQKWIIKNPYWTLLFFRCLFSWSKDYINLSSDTFLKLQIIEDDLEGYIWETKSKNLDIETIIFRYKKEYKSQYDNNSELSMFIAKEEYKKYLRWKFND